MTLTMDLLDQIEREAASAPASLLRMRLDQVRMGCALASNETRDYASVLLLKLEHRLRTETVGTSGSGAGEEPVYLAPRIGVAGASQQPQGRRRASHTMQRPSCKARRPAISA